MPAFVEASGDLKKSGIVIVGLDLKKSLPARFLVVETSKTKIKMSETMRDHLYEKFLEFAKSTWIYESIGDFSPRQIGRDGSGSIGEDANIFRGSYADFGGRV